MKRHTIVFILALVVVAILVFVLYPSIDPITMEYKNIWGSQSARAALTLEEGHYNLAFAKGLLLEGYVGDSFEYFGRALVTPVGILTVLGLMYLVTLAVWIYISWLIGRRKGKPGLGVILGLFLGFIGLIIMLLLPDDETRQDAQRIESGEYRKCPHCAETIRAEAKVCKHCGRDV